MSATGSYSVAFNCGHRAHLLPDEYGDGSAWCQVCGGFQEYMRCLECGALDCDHPLYPRPAGSEAARPEETIEGGLIHQPMRREMGVDAPDFGPMLGAAADGTGEPE